MDLAGGMACKLTRIRYTTSTGNDGETLKKESVVIKTLNPGTLPRSIQLGLAREAIFYRDFATTVSTHHQGLLPTVYAADGDMASGQKVMMLEDLGAVGAIQLGYFFGPGSPHNWNRDLAALTKDGGIVDSADAARVAFEAMAALHAQFWCDQGLLDSGRHAWLRGAQWYANATAVSTDGKSTGDGGEKAFLAAQASAADCWATTRTKISNGDDGGVRWDSRLVAAMDASIARASWPAYQSRIKSTVNYTLVHGDSHPANMMWVPTTRRLVLLDFEVVGVGSGPQDVGQFVVSHMSPLDRRAAEQKLVRGYYDAVINGGVDPVTFPWSECWREYGLGGTERWVWLLSLLTTMCPANMVQFFHDQVLAFMVDHGISAENIGMPRV
ncbi:kinase-like domain-containing protein [Blastocladiella britannica]|nr:kinase-like domain-containing protein [Blastocladiella britannica]